MMEHYRAATTFSRLQQATSSSVTTNRGGGAAPTDRGAIKKSEGKWKRESRGKGKATEERMATRDPEEKERKATKKRMVTRNPKEKAQATIKRKRVQ